jgi:hypothetical protein
VSSTLREIADAVRGALAAVSFSSTDIQPVVVRQNWPEYDVEAVAGPVIVVTPATATVTRTNRTNHEYVYSVAVWVARHTPTEALADDLLDFAEEVMDELRSSDLTGLATSPTSVEIEINPDEALQERNVWRAVITAGYTVFRPTVGA